MKRLLVHVLPAFIAFFLLTTCTAQQRDKPAAIILDTDIGPDYDDVGAMALLHALADSGECRILATIASNKHQRIAAVIDVINTYFNRPRTPIGVVRGAAVDLEASQKWDSLIVARYPHDLKRNEDAEDAVTLYRRLLASERDGSVTIVTVGFLTNMANLLESPPDNHSPLNGRDLVARKVRRLVSMAGRFDAEMGTFQEFNVVEDSSASKRAFDRWPTPIIFSGFEIGHKIFSGVPLVQSDVRNSPVKDVFERSIPMDPADRAGRMSWDQTAVLVAVRGTDRYFGTKNGRFVCHANGSNSWQNEGKQHSYLTTKMPPEEVAAVINQLMMHQPVNR